MKLHVKLLSFAAVLMSLVTSCVNEGIQEPQDADILKMIPALEDQAAAVEASVKDLQNLQTELEANGAELDGKVSEALEQHVADLKKGGMSLEEGTFAAFELQKQLGAAVGSALAELEADNKLQKNVDALEKSVKAWVGESFNALYPAAVAEARIKATVARFDSKLGNQKLYVDALVSDVEAGLRKDEKPEELKALAASVKESLATSKKLGEDFAGLVVEVSSEYETAVKSVLSDASGFDAEGLREFNANAGIELASVDNSLASLVARVEACESQLQDILARLGALEGVVGDLQELLGMIQSVNLLSEYSSEVAVAYYDMGTASTSEGYKVRQPKSTIDLSYVVRPASAASALTASSLWNNGLKVFGYYANRIAQSAVGEFVNFNIQNVTADATTGVVNVTVENNLNEDFYYKKVGAKMALSVTTGKTDLTSKFMEIVPKDASNTVYLEGLSLSKDYVEFDEGQELNLSAIVTPNNVTNSEMVWTSANNDIVSVSGTGRLTAKAVGTTTVTATSKGTDEWGRTLSASCTVKVNPAIRLSGPSYVEVGKSVEMSLDFPASMAIESKEWSTSDASKATVSTAGVVTGVGHTYNTANEDYGTITVYCKINGTTTVSHEMKVVVTQPTSIKLNNYADNVSEITIKVDESLDLGATIVPEVPADQFRLFYQSTYGLGWIDSATGKVNANKNVAGVAYVYIDVMNYDKTHYFAPGKSLRRTVIVRVNPYYVKTIQLDDVDLELGQAATLSPNFTSDVAGKQPTNTAVTWTSSNTAVATVDQNGKVTSVAGGTATITATATDGSNVSGSCTVTVTERWKDFNVGDYVVITSSGDIEFSADLNAAKSKGTVVGVVIIQTNPRVTDTELPSNCTHGIAIALTETANLKWQNSASNVGQWLEQNNGYNYLQDTEHIRGYSNTKALQAYNAVCSSDNKVLPAACAPNISLGSVTSGWYLPSYAELKMLFEYEQSTRSETISNGAIANKIVAAGGTPFSISTKNFNTPDGAQDASSYWASTESSASSSWATGVHFLYGGFTNKSKTSKSYYIARYVFAF